MFHFTLLLILLQFIFNQSNYIALESKFSKYHAKELAENSQMYMENDDMSTDNAFEQIIHDPFKVWENICSEETLVRCKDQVVRWYEWAEVCMIYKIDNAWGLNKWKTWCDILNNTLSEYNLDDYYEFMTIKFKFPTMEHFQKFFSYKKNIWNDIQKQIKNQWEDFLKNSIIEWSSNVKQCITEPPKNIKILRR
ncbi:Plasmodium exported protein, unknown function [Plasmodium relictum]|uniref:Tryptophan-rich antigen n=1 Tax=Plasmodium relictum TaxID=85471 RepID=A0A1J1HGG3_PLARL|nr:Plasmodium exported protein, unknown function [Plasmodium relictum]CRH02941.1 Plasmodium exported protein, unknown function [Plasmodium relictum]